MANGDLATFNNYGYFNAYANNIYIQDTYPITCMVEATRMPRTARITPP